MIAYEELEKALARWKARRPDPNATAPVVVSEASEVTVMGDPEASAMGEPSILGIPTGISDDDSAAEESTGEVEIGTGAIVDRRHDD